MDEQADFRYGLVFEASKTADILGSNMFGYGRLRGALGLPNCATYARI
jgi:hypothetical protein